jgi:hypothetical protein
MLDEASGEEYQNRAREWLAILVRLHAETRSPWTASAGREAFALLHRELASDWEDIFARQQRILGASGKVRNHFMDAARDRAREFLDQEVQLLVMKQDRTRVPLAERLAADRYTQVAEGWRKAHRYLDGPSPDLPNAAKEAVGAVETLAQLLIGDGKATLGEAIRRLRATGRVEAPLLKGIEELWGWSNSEEGVRHSSTRSPVDLADVRYCFRLAEAALDLLLAKDAA